MSYKKKDVGRDAGSEYLHSAAPRKCESTRMSVEPGECPARSSGHYDRASQIFPPVAGSRFPVYTARRPTATLWMMTLPSRRAAMSHVRAAGLTIFQHRFHRP